MNIPNTKYPIPFTRGVTALELLIVIGILGILVSIIVPSFLNFRRNSILNTETLQMVTLINKARLSSISSKGDMQYGIHFQGDRVVLFQGTTYLAGAVTNEEHVFNSALTLSAIPADVVFQKITGATALSAIATSTLRVIANISASSTVVVQPTGVASTY